MSSTVWPSPDATTSERRVQFAVDSRTYTYRNSHGQWMYTTISLCYLGAHKTAIRLLIVTNLCEKNTLSTHPAPNSYPFRIDVFLQGPGPAWGIRRMFQFTLDQHSIEAYSILTNVVGNGWLYQKSIWLSATSTPCGMVEMQASRIRNSR